MTHAPFSPNAGALRLVRPGETPAEPISRATLSPARDRVRRENQRAARLTEHDARRILALRASEALQGGRAALLTPERRERLMTISRAMGLRPFDASLIIAIVQDAARRTGHPTRDTDLGLARGINTDAPDPIADDPAVQSRLSFIPLPARSPIVRAARATRRRVSSVLISWAAAVALAAALVLALIRWITRG